MARTPKARHAMPGTTEIYEIPLQRNVKHEFAAIREAGGTIVSSAPVQGGYVVHVFWRD